MSLGTTSTQATPTTEGIPPVLILVDALTRAASVLIPAPPNFPSPKVQQSCPIVTFAAAGIKILTTLLVANTSAAAAVAAIKTATRTLPFWEQYPLSLARSMPGCIRTCRRVGHVLNQTILE